MFGMGLEFMYECASERYLEKRDSKIYGPLKFMRTVESHEYFGGKDLANNRNMSDTSYTRPLLPSSTIVDGAGGRSLWLRFLLVVVIVGWNKSSICPMNLKSLMIFLSLSNKTVFTPRRAFGADYTASALVPKKYQALDTKNQHQAIIRQQKSISQ